jgi:drug/metabolite transporter (DMT)-like permease
MTLDKEKRPPKKLKYAVPLILLAGFFVACMATVVKEQSGHLNAESLVFWRNIISLIILLPLFPFSKPQGSFFTKIKTREWKLHLIRGLTSFLAVYLYFFSLKFIDLTSATLLFNTIPIFVPIVALLWQKIKIHHTLWWAIATSFIGIIFVLQPGARIFHFAAILALLSGIIAAISLVSLRLGHYSEPPARMLFYLFVICILASLGLTPFNWKSSWDVHADDILFLLALGISGFLYQVCMTAATKFAPIRLISPFLYGSVFFTMLFDIVFWKTTFSLYSLIGFFLVVVGAFLTIALYPEDDMQRREK